jgi:hypothetical protein
MAWQQRETALVSIGRRAASEPEWAFAFWLIPIAFPPRLTDRRPLLPVARSEAGTVLGEERQSRQRVMAQRFKVVLLGEGEHAF